MVDSRTVTDSPLSHQVDEGWLAARVSDIESQAWEDTVAVDRLRDCLRRWAHGFAAHRADVVSDQIAWPRRGLHPDEAAAFLRALDAGTVSVNEAGYVTVHCVRPKQPQGRYALLARSGQGVSVNLEYLIQLGATNELATDGHWPPELLDFERGEFDLLGHDPHGQVTLVMEAKARATGPDSLATLVTAWLAYSRLDDPAHLPATNAGRKYRELWRLARDRPVAVWLVAAGARWNLAAHMDDDRLVLSNNGATGPPTPTARRPGGREVLWVRPYDLSLHHPGTMGARAQCSWLCTEPAEYSVRVREIAGTESTFALCASHLDRVQQVYNH